MLATGALIDLNGRVTGRTSGLVPNSEIAEVLDLGNHCAGVVRTRSSEPLAVLTISGNPPDSLKHQLLRYLAGGPGRYAISTEGVAGVAQLRGDFSIREFAGTGETRRVLRPGQDSVLSPATPSDTARWVAVGLVRTERGYLQLIADLKSDRRLLVSYDVHSGSQRSTVVEAPLGLIDSQVEAKRLLAIRELDEVEVVWYRWAWSTPMSKNSNP